MGQFNMGGRMPDGSWAQDCWVDEADFVCASGAMISKGIFKQVLGKLCLTRSALVMLPYEGVALMLVQKLCAQLRKTVLGPYEDVAEVLDALGLYPQPEVLEKTLVWPLAEFEAYADVRNRKFLFIEGGADLVVRAGGETWPFNMAARGHEVGDFASAQDFRDCINQLLE